MELDERVTELERRLAALERSEREPQPGADTPDDGFWALKGLKAALAREGAANGGVLFTGAITLPTGEDFEWQNARPVDALLDEDWSGAAESFAALGNAVRMRLLREILGGRRTVAELAALEGLGTTGQVYHHLRQLTATGWLRTAGKSRYEVPATRVVPILVALAAARP
ncbi:MULTISPECIES: ArsR/SmtB family transcription factor [unclassified Streptosporangium]|uniref:ArsR/SmtB family transcription factor n=1 Tax=unclassified Streptosporangium TaxID=2632669 RepID=UPI002E28A839|nr:MULTISPECIES: winged helix-turn-helix domain-containing protein [unclassified Streptosporangium]